MKKVLLSTLLLVSSALLYTGCKKDDDSTAPVITLNGDNPMYVVAIDSNFITMDPGATAVDDNDGDLTSQITVDYSEYVKNVAGEYEIHYEVADKAGNTTDEHRIIYNTNTGSQLAGTFNAKDTSASGLTQLDYSLSTSTSTLSKFRINTLHFSQDIFGASTNVYMTLEANRVTIPSQKPNGTTSTITLSGSGTITFNSVSGEYTMRLAYTIADSGVGGTTTNYTSTMVSQ